jgi:membrane fusion protein (multidrug efflux system)
MMPVPGQASGLIQLARLDPLKIDLSVDDRTVALVTKKMPVVVTTDVLPDTSFSGEVEYVNPLANPASRTFQVRVIVRNTGGLLKAGYFAEVGVLIDHRDSVLTVPAAAVVGGKVFVVRDSVATALPVVTGWEEDGFVEIRSGLSGESAVIVGGNKALPDTARVEVVKAEDGNG